MIASWFQCQFSSIQNILPTKEIRFLGWQFLVSEWFFSGCNICRFIMIAYLGEVVQWFGVSLG